jgi:type I restriction enzyme S subunit
VNAAGQGSLKSVFRAGDVLFGKLRAYLRKYWLADRPGICSTEIWVLAINSAMTTPGFVRQIVATDPFIDTASTAYGTHMPRSDWSLVRNMEIRTPSISEQTAISAALSDMDMEIAALEARGDKTRALKQGMMQELLTGKTRLA